MFSIAVKAVVLPHALKDLARILRKLALATFLTVTKLAFVNAILILELSITIQRACKERAFVPCFTQVPRQDTFSVVESVIKVPAVVFFTSFELPPALHDSAHPNTLVAFRIV